MAEITPITREEFYLAKAGGQDVPVPSAVTREEYYLEKLSNDSVVVPTPVTRREKFLYFACGGDVTLPSEDKMTRLERLIAKAGGMDVATPTAVTRLEKFWANVEGGGWKIAELTGALPMTFRADGTALINYRIYGTAEGVGVQTENLFSGKGVTGNIGAPSVKQFRDSNIQVSPGEIYFINASSVLYSRLGFYMDDTRKSNSSWTTNQASITVPNDCNNAYVEVRNYDYDVITNEQLATATEIMLTKGSTPPETYIPHGYKLPLTLTSGTESKDTDIYIGGTKLLSGDYVDYETGKIDRNGTPQDPPLPLPAIETFKGTNTLDSTETLGQVTIKGMIKEAE